MSMRSQCFGCLRSLMIIICFLKAVLASLFIYVSFNAFDQDYVVEVTGGDQPKLIHSYVTIILVGIGLIGVILAILGFIGSIKRSKSILGTYAAIVTILVSILILTTLLTYTKTYSDALSKDVDKQIVSSTLVLYNYVDQSDRKTQIIDKLQRSFACCGVNSPNDWNDYIQRNIPKSCCAQPTLSSFPVFKYCRESDYKIGCWKALTDHIQANSSAVRLVLYILIAFESFCALAACFMIQTMRKSLDVV